MAQRTRPLRPLRRRLPRRPAATVRECVATIQRRCPKTAMSRAIRVALCVGLMATPLTVSTRAVAGGPADYGDAPAPFPTLDADFGPAHSPTGPQLGSLRDSEADGVPSSNADGDDLNGSDDEDGVTLQPSLIGSANGSITVNLQNGPAQLDAWIDFNGDGSWGGNAEHVFIDRTLANGDNVLTLSVPADARSAPVVARFRISSAGGLGQGGLSSDGEVEDHRLTFSAPTASNAPLFDSGQALGDDFTRELALVDVDGDGDLDLIAVEGQEYETGLVNRIYFNDGNGNFSDSGQALATDASYGLAVGDVDGDGDLDLITTNSNTSDPLRLYRNDGSGSFSLDGSFSTSGFNPNELELVDLDSDGDLDLYIGTTTTDRVYLNDGSGAFSDSGQTLGSGILSLGLSAGDIDGDGDIDIFVSSANNDANRSWINNGSGVFSAGTSLGTERSWDSALGDFDGDGDLDLAEGRVSGVYVWLNDGAGNFSGETQLSSNDVDSIALADMNGDGILDLIEGVDGGGNRIYLGNGAGSFSDSGQSLGSASTQAIAIGDVNGDGRLDLIDGSDAGANGVWLNSEYDFGDAAAPFDTLLSAGGARHVASGPQMGALRDAEGNGLPSAGADGDDLDGVDDEDGVTLIAAPIGSALGAVTVNLQNGPAQLDAWIDFNGDGSWGGPFEHVVIDQALADGDNGLPFQVPANIVAGAVTARFRVSTAGAHGMAGEAADGEVEDHLLTLNGPTASSGNLVDSGQALGSGQTRELALVDVDGDGDLDLIDVEGREYTTGLVDRIFLNDGNGNFSDSGQMLATDGTYGLAVGDVDGDGDVDLITANIDTGDSLRLYRNDGLGNFSLDAASGISGFLAFRPRLADLDGDGDLDLYTGNQVSNRVYLNDGTGLFTDTGQLLGTGVITQDVVFGDIDGDGDIDLFEASVNGDPNRPWFNNGSGFFTAGTSLGTERSRAATLGDFDGDGDLDLVEGRVTGTFIWLNDGLGNFGGETQLSSTEVDAVALADMNGDGILDLIEGVDGGANRILLGDGAGNFSDSGQTLGSESTQALAIGDVDGDGTLDLVDGIDDGANRVWINGDFDFGDAVAPFPTLISGGGARHGLSGPTLGALRDQEADGLPSANADGDDLDGIDDEDGVTLISAPIGTALGGMTVNVQNGPGQLDAWVDFNGDGSWSGPFEHVVINQAVANGDNGLPFQIPADAISGAVAARFRVSSAGGHAQGGAASDGEVEDHLLTLAAPTSSVARLLDSGQLLGNDISHEVALVDVDGDGDLDLISTASGPSNDRKINRVYLNDGSGNFTDSGQTLGTNDTYGLAIGDVDGDGDVDIVAGNANNGSAVLFYLNDGSGAFTLNAGATISGFNTGELELLDLDNDGDLDLYVGGLNDPNRVYLNDGSGNFSDTGQLLADEQTLGVEAGDIDGDGDIDVYETTGGGDINRFWFNDGSGTFTAGPSLGSARAWNSALGDVDGDGDLDLIEGRSNGASGSYLRLNDGSGSFDAATALSSTEVYALQLADMDGDGDLDLVEGNYTGGNQVLLNDGSGNFSNTGQSLGSGVTYGIAVGDVDGDGDLDVVDANYTGPNQVWINSTVDLGDAPAPYPTLIADGGALHGNSGPTLGALRDSEADGLPTAGADGDDLDGIDDEDGVTLISAPIGTALGGMTVNVQNGPGQLDAWVDFNGDGSWSGPFEHVVIDRAVANGDNGVPFQIPADAISGAVAARFRVSTAGAHGQGGDARDGEVEDHLLTLSAPTVSAAQLADSGQLLGNDISHEVALVDVDGDGDLDLISTASGPSNDRKINRVYLNDGSGNFTDSGQTLGTNDTYGLAIGDVDGDGDVDLVAGNANTSSAVLFYLNDGGGNFTLNAGATISGFNTGELELLDLDKDGDLDLYIGALNDPNRVYLNDGSGSFTDTGQRLADEQTLGIEAGDIDGDGDIDVYESTGGGDINRFWFNDGSGTFTAGPSLGSARAWNSALGDVDGDGDLDLIEGRSNGASGSYLRLNDGSGSFDAATALSSTEVYALQLADMDGDGDLDLVEGNYTGGNQVLLNDGSGNFSNTGQSLGSGVTYGIAVGDVDGDGDLDVVDANYTGPNQVWINRKPSVQLSVDSNSGSEAAASVITVTATADATVVGSQTVDLMVSGTGITAGDYVLGNTQLTITDGTTTASTSFTVVDDSLNEGDEDAMVSISTVSSGLTIGTLDSQTITIIDDDPLPTVASLSFSAASFAETGGAITLDLTLDRASAFDQCYTVSFGGVAALGSDYSVSDDDAAAGIQACASAGSTSAQLIVTPIDDAIFEGDESISAMSGALSAGTTLTDAEDTPTVTALLFDPDSISENGGVSQLMLTQSNIATAPQCYTVALSGSADFGVDYTIADDDGAAGLQLCVAAGESLRSVAVAAIDDAVFEGDENVLASSGGFDATLNLIEDKSPPTVQSLSFDAATLAETGSDIGLLVTLNRLSEFESCQTISFAGSASFGVDYAVSDDDPLTAGVQACVEAGAIDTDLTLSPIDDSTFEGDESIDASSGAGASSVTLTDDEDAPTLTALAFDPTSATENGGISQLSVTQSNLATVQRCFLMAVSGSATLDTDYSIADDDPGAPVSLCVAPGELTRSVPLTGIDDLVFEGDESVQVDSGGLSATLTLLEDKTAPIVSDLAFSAASFAEDGAAIALILSLNRATTTDLCFNISFAGDAQLGTDYSVDDAMPAPGVQACVIAGDTSTQLAVTPIDDAVFEGNEFLAAGTAGLIANTILTDAEDLPQLTALAFDPISVSENGGISQLTATQSNPATMQRCYLMAVAGSATIDVDYSIVDDDLGAPVRLCVAPTELSRSVPVTGIDDAVFEGDETVQMDSNGLSATLTLLEDKNAPSVVAMSFSAASFAENGPAISLDLTLDRAASTDQCFDVSFAGTALLATDYAVSDDNVAAGIQACATAGAIGAQLSVTPIDDAVFEGDEAIIADSGGVVANTTLTDAEDTPTLTALAFDPLSISENGGSSTLTATQSNPAMAARCYDLGVAGSATFDGDYVIADDDPGAGLQLCVPASELQGDLPLLAVDDNLFEGDETAQMSSGGFSTTLTLVDDENLPQVLDWSFDRAAFPEDGGMATLQLILTHPWQDPRCLDVSYSGSADLNVDYGSEDQDGSSPGVQLCLPAAGTVGNLLLVGIDDSEIEGKEQIVADLTEPEAASASVFIGDDESAVPLFADGFEDPLPPEPEE